MADILKNMKKIIVILILVLLGLLAIRFINSQNFDQNYGNDYYHSHTRAICESNQCQDYYIECNKEKVIRINPTGSVIVMSDNWNDKRNEESKKISC